MVIKIISKQTILIVYAYIWDVEFKNDLIYTVKKNQNMYFKTHTHTKRSMLNSNMLSL